MQYLVGTDSVHTTAAICDYLDDRATADDEVTVVSVVPPEEDGARRDAQEALNVASVRLVTIGTVETELREGEPATALLDAAASIDADELVVGTHGGRPTATAALGSTAQQLLEETSNPVVVVPIPEL